MKLNALHTAALALLTPDWQRFRDLATRPNSMVVLDDLVVAKRAEVRREPITVNGVSCGEVTYFRAAPPR
jgi:hypothetical protein